MLIASELLEGMPHLSCIRLAVHRQTRVVRLGSPVAGKAHPSPLPGIPHKAFALALATTDHEAAGSKTGKGGQEI